MLATSEPKRLHSLGVSFSSRQWARSRTLGPTPFERCLHQGVVGTARDDVPARDLHEHCRESSQPPRENTLRLLDGFQLHDTFPIPHDRSPRSSCSERRSAGSLLLWCRSSRVSVSARLRGRSHRKGKIEHGRHHPVRAVGLPLALRRTRFLGVAIAFLWELPIARVINPRPGRGAGKARLFDPLRESFGGERCTPCKADESFTQDSDGAPLRRGSSIRRRGSFGGRRCTSRLAGVKAAKRGRHEIPSPRSRAGSALAFGKNCDMRVRHWQ